MKTLTVYKRQIYLVVGGNTTRQMLELVAQMAIRGPLRVLDGSNSFNVNVVARNLRRLTSQIHPALGRIFIARAFTCYEMATLVNNTPTDGIATFMTGLLSSFYDEDVPLIESQRLLGACVQTLQNLCLSQPLVISSSPPFQRIAERMVLLEMLMDVAYQVINIEEITPVNVQLSLPL